MKRADTIRAYKSFLELFKKYIENKKIPIKFVVKIDVFMIQNYLDYLYYERKNSSSTYNNHLRFLNTFLLWCKSKNFIPANPLSISKQRQKHRKSVKLLTPQVKDKVKKLHNTHFHFYVLCMLTYYCFIRRTELTKLKVSDVNLSGGYIIISGENSKNRKTESVTIPSNLLPDLAQHLITAHNSDYLFSQNNYKPGKKAFTPKKISDEWAKFRKEGKFDSKFQFYSLKDTGITDLLNSSMPAIKIRDQARHYDLKITESYIAGNKFADEMIKNVSFFSYFRAFGMCFFLCFLCKSFFKG